MGMSDIEWADPPPPRGGRYDAFFDALRAEPGRWALFPVQTTSAASAVRRGAYRGIEPLEFEAMERHGQVYVRYPRRIPSV
jgi:hypothetical protein